MFVLKLNYELKGKSSSFSIMAVFWIHNVNPKYFCHLVKGEATVTLVRHFPGMNFTD